MVTGASSGIGRSFAVRLAQAGLNLVLVSRSHQTLEQLASELCMKYGVQTRVLALDLSRADVVDTLVTGTQDLDIGLLVAAAGFGTSGPFLESSLDQEMEMLAVNCRAVSALSWWFGRRFVAQGHGGLILVSSILSFQGNPLAAHYAATKGYIQSFGEALHAELHPLGVDVLVSAPGPTWSGFGERAGQQMRVALQPDEVAQSTLRALGRTSTVLPGLLSKLIRYSTMMLPRWGRIRIMGFVMRDMTKHRSGEFRLG